MQVCIFFRQINHLNYMKLCIVGSNSFNNYPIFDEIVNKIIKKVKLNDLEIVIPKDKFTTNSFELAGVANLAKIYCDYTYIPLIEEEPNWADLNHPDAIIKYRSDNVSRYNSNAFSIRNDKIIREADFVLLIFFESKPDPLKDIFVSLCKKYDKIHFIFEF